MTVETAEPSEGAMQIRRPRHSLDVLPEYSTVELLMGVCHIVHGLRYKANKPVLRTQTSHRAMRNDTARQLEEHFEAIQARLLECRTNAAIAKELSLPISAIRRLIRNSTPLEKLSESRCDRRKEKRGKVA